MLLWSPRQPGRHIAVEVKVATKLSPEQEAVLAELAASGFEVFVVREDDLGELAKALTPRVAGNALPSGTNPDLEDTP